MTVKQSEEDVTTHRSVGLMGFIIQGVAVPVFCHLHCGSCAPFGGGAGEAVQASRERPVHFTRGIWTAAEVWLVP